MKTWVLFNKTYMHNTCVTHRNWTEKIYKSFRRYTELHGDAENIDADHFQVFHIIFAQNDLIDCDCYIVYVPIDICWIK